MIYSFEEYELDLQRYELRCAGRLVKIERQVFNLLAYLIQHRDRLITKEELFDELWAGRVVGEATLTSRVRAARKAVGDDGRVQRLIQTLHGRGYRFIAPIEERAGDTADLREPPPSARLPSLTEPDEGRINAMQSPRHPPHGIVEHRAEMAGEASADEALPSMLISSTAGRAVGRAAELAQLHARLQQALGGTRQVVFVTGEAGLGKTTLVEAFLEDIPGYGRLWVGHSQCLEQYGPGEAYMPVLEAIGRLCREPTGQTFLDLLVRQAPTWVVQMPWLADDAMLETLQRRVMGATRQRMLREMAEAIEVLTAECPIVLVLEDLQVGSSAVRRNSIGLEENCCRSCQAACDMPTQRRTRVSNVLST